MNDRDFGDPTQVSLFRIQSIFLVWGCNGDEDYGFEDGGEGGHTKVYTGIPRRWANIFANDLQFCFEPLIPISHPYLTQDSRSKIQGFPQFMLTIQGVGIR